jgi:hypothetical protein
MYYGALRPAEAVNLRKADCDLPSAGWGRLYLSRTTPEVGRRYTDSGELHDDKGLKHRSEDEVRPMPIPPELVAFLKAHIDRYRTAPDGRLFRQSNGNVVGTSTYTQVWRAARTFALLPEQVASPLAGRPYDLRHAAVSLWLNAGVPAPTVARPDGRRRPQCVLLRHRAPVMEAASWASGRPGDRAATYRARVRDGAVLLPAHLRPPVIRMDQQAWTECHVAAFGFFLEACRPGWRRKMFRGTFSLFCARLRYVADDHRRPSTKVSISSQ